MNCDDLPASPASFVIVLSSAQLRSGDGVGAPGVLDLEHSLFWSGWSLARLQLREKGGSGALDPEPPGSDRIVGQNLKISWGVRSWLWAVTLQRRLGEVS